MSKHLFPNFKDVLTNASMWEKIPYADPEISLGQGNPNFLYGVGTSMYQDSGAIHSPNSQWRTWENKKLTEPAQSGAANDLFQLYQTQPLEIIQRLKLLNVNTYRFSVEWSHLESVPGKFDDEKLQIYVKLCRLLRDHGIQPFVTLHHFSEPSWFHELGSFEKKENIGYFRRFCRWVFKELTQSYQGKTLVQFFCTINEPNIDAYARYIVGYFPPNLRVRFKRAAVFLLNMLVAHDEVYTELKMLAEQLQIKNIKIGFSHQYLRAYALHPLVRPAAHILNKFWNDSVLNFFKTGIFKFKIPCICNVTADYSQGRKPKTDFIGVQFYGRIYLGFKGVVANNKAATSMWGVYEDPEGLYEAITTVFDAVRVPIFITENGISTLCEEQRARYLARALYAAEQARQYIGAENLLGYILWSFSDNFEWFLGWTAHFGAFALTSTRTLNENYKPGVQPFIDTVNAWKNSFEIEIAPA